MLRWLGKKICATAGLNFPAFKLKRPSEHPVLEWRQMP
jgi:hypothetical protein